MGDPGMLQQESPTPTQHPAVLTGTDTALQAVTQHPAWLPGEGSDAGPGFQSHRMGSERGGSGLREQWPGAVAPSSHHPLACLARPCPGPGGVGCDPWLLPQVKGRILCARDTHTLTAHTPAGRPQLGP